MDFNISLSNRYILKDKVLLDKQVRMDISNLINPNKFQSNSNNNNSNSNKIEFKLNNLLNNSNINNLTKKVKKVKIYIC